MVSQAPAGFSFLLLEIENTPGLFSQPQVKISSGFDGC